MPVPIAEKRPPKALMIKAKDALAARGALGQRWQVVAVVDVSGSMQGFFQEGIVDGIVSRVVGAAMAVDDNGDVPVYAMDTGCRLMSENATANNVDGFVHRHLSRLVGGGTNYAPTINQIVQDAQAGDPMLVMWFTDGENNDEAPATRAMIEASRLPIFFQFFGIYGGGREPRFTFLEELDTLRGRTVDNAGFSKINLTTITDEQLMELIFHEAVSFPKVAEAAGLLPWTASAGQKKSRFGFGR